MSNIAEKRVKELWCSKDPFNREEFTANDIFDCDVECYDQAVQDFLEKACEWLEDTQLENFICRDDGVYFDNEKLIEQFKNYIKKEV